MERNFDIVEFASASVAGVVNIQLGYVPDYVEFVSDHGGTPKVMKWLNPVKYPNFPASRTVQILGGTAVFAPDGTSMITAYTGYERLTADQTVNSAPKHIDREGVAGLNGRMTQAGITISAAAQVNSGRNIVFAYRGSK